MDTSGSFGLTFIHSLPKSMPITDADDPEASSTKPAIAALICIVVLPSLNDSELLGLLAKKFDGHAAPYHATKTEVDGTSYGTLIKSLRPSKTRRGAVLYLERQVRHCPGLG
jgi:hypothetical protein